jgi:hypothetical protein
LFFLAKLSVDAALWEQRLKTENETIENGNFHLFAAKGKRQQETSVVYCKKKWKNRNLFSLVGKR